MKRQRYLTALLSIAAINVSLQVGCSSSEPPKSPEQIEKSRIEHQERSKREQVEG
jgi:hypothetical protein